MSTNRSFRREPARAATGRTCRQHVEHFKMLTLAQQSSFNVIFLDVTVLIFSLIDYLRVFFLRAVQRQQGYASLQDEAVRVFNSLQEMETLADTVPIIQGILQTCQDLRPLRDEVLLYIYFQKYIKLEYFISHRIFFQFSSCLHSDKNLFPTGLLPGDQADQSCASA